MERMHARTVAELMHIAARLGVGGEQQRRRRFAHDVKRASRGPASSRRPSGAH
jgi:hypothetical protein